MTAGFTVGAALSVGWEKLKGNFWLCCGAVASAWLVPGVSQIALTQLLSAMTGGASAEWTFLNSLLAFVSFVLQCTLSMGVFKLALNLVDGGKADITDLFACIDSLLKFVIATFLYLVMVMVGAILLIVPGIIVAVQFGFYIFGVVDKGLGPLDALRYSSQVTLGAKWNLFALSMAGFGFWVLGLLCLVVGVIPAVAVIVIAVTYAYRQLSADQAVPEPQD